MLRPKKNSYKEFDNEKKFLRLENSPPPHNFSNGPSLRKKLFVNLKRGSREDNNKNNLLETSIVTKWKFLGSYYSREDNARLFTVPYFSVRLSRDRRLCFYTGGHLYR